jgi:hypothetical protein
VGSVEVPSGKILWDKVFPFKAPELRYTGPGRVCLLDPSNKALVEYDEATDKLQTIAQLAANADPDDVSIVSVK